MFFLVLLGIGTLFLAAVSGFFSVWGLSQTFQHIFWSVVLMGAGLEAGKLLSASFLYRYSKIISKIHKAYLIGAILVLMAITSVGHYGYLSNGYLVKSVSLDQTSSQLQLLEQQKVEKEKRKEQIDAQIANLPSNFVRNRIKLMGQFQDEQKQVTKQIDDLDQQILALKSTEIQKTGDLGPIVYVAKLIHIEPDVAVKYLVLLIVAVFDPLVVVLTISWNIAFADYQENKIRPPVRRLKIPMQQNIEQDEPEPSVTSVDELEPEEWEDEAEFETPKPYPPPTPPGSRNPDGRTEFQRFVDDELPIIGVKEEEEPKEQTPHNIRRVLHLDTEQKKTPYVTKKS